MAGRADAIGTSSKVSDKVRCPRLKRSDTVYVHDIFLFGDWLSAVVTLRVFLFVGHRDNLVCLKIGCILVASRQRQRN